MSADWLQIARNQAEERFRSLPFPTGKDENFRFTPLEYKPAETGTATGSPLPSDLAKLDSDELALLLLEGEEARFLGATPGFLFTDILRAAALGSDPLRSRLKDDNSFRDDKFAQLTGARWRNGAFLHVPAGVKVAKPLRFVTHAMEAEEHSRHLIVLEEGAELVLVQESWSDEAARFCGELVEVRLGRNSKLHWVTLQQLGRNTEAVIRQRVELAEGAELKLTPLHLGGKLVQVRQEVHLSGEGASLEAQAAARGDGQQHFDFWLDVRHESAGSRSQMDYWFVMAEKAKAVFNGQIEVKHGAADCESSQRSKSLLLGSGAVHSIPKLIIKTDAVKCSHGASVSSVSFEQLHYLQSRGIPRNEAEQMIVRGFTEKVVERLPTESLIDRAETLIENKAGGVHG
ncbi:MAG TPA: SufD family Fe-S cluster assembly protein [Bdellovibrionota bacterium]|jgi:Fe-S cluster assembly protein SufD